jgi:NAD(P)-dependent dehydrogenase (short-subunit alcohol dehydrogenase family)
VNRPIRDWNRRRVWMIGASSGIGAATATAMLDRGARVALSARSEDGLARIAAGRGDAALVMPLDVSVPDQLRAAWDRIRESWGGADLVLYMAGTYRPLRAWEITPDLARQTIETNLLGAMHAVSVVLPDLLACGEGAIALTASVAGYRGLPKAVLYGPSKSALINFAETLYLDLEPKGISVYAINPGFVATPLTAQNDFRMPALISSEQAAEHILRGFAAGRFEIHFPRRFTLMMKVLEWLPYPLYFRIVRSMTGL